MPSETPCPNCGEINGGCFFPPSLGEPGFFVCQPPDLAALIDTATAKQVQRCIEKLRGMEDYNAREEPHLRVIFPTSIEAAWPLAVEVKMAMIATDDAPELICRCWLKWRLAEDREQMPKPDETALIEDHFSRVEDIILECCA